MLFLSLLLSCPPVQEPKTDLNKGSLVGLERVLARRLRMEKGKDSESIMRNLAIQGKKV